MTEVFVTTTFVGFHRWRAAPDKVKFLREWHRHVFQVTVWVYVTHGDREVEFFILKEAVENLTLPRFHEKYFELSCEQIAAELLALLSHEYKVSCVEVNEDGENGALVHAG